MRDGEQPAPGEPPAARPPAAPPRPLTGAQAVVQVLLEQGVEYVFGIPGGAVLPLYDAMYDAPLRHVLVRH
ncbi:MAG TPA: thiamine pyrophosphate-binding protein, partial [Thermaerobacter sp.]